MNSILLSSMLSLLLISNTSALTSVKVKLHDAATLHCSHTCSGLVMWTVSHKPRDILAQCNQTSCQSEEGFHMAHDQYLKGDLSLTITDVDYSKRTWYTCECDDVEICDVSLKIEAVNVPKPVSPGESLSMDVSVSEPVEVTLNRTGDTKPNTVILCKIKGRELQCVPEYEKRVSFSSSLQLKDLKESDSGVYTIWDTRNEEIIATYTVTVGAVRVPKPVHPGESLIMDVPVSDPVMVILNRTGDTKPNTVRLCDIKGRELQCDPEYEKRVSFSSSLQLKSLKESDSGVYTIWDIRNEEVIVTYTVIVGGIHEDHDTYKNVPKETGMWVLAVVLPLVLLVLLVLLVVVQYRKKLQNCLHLNQEQEKTDQDNPEREAAIQNQPLNPESSNFELL